MSSWGAAVVPVVVRLAVGLVVADPAVAASVVAVAVVVGLDFAGLGTGGFELRD